MLLLLLLSISVATEGAGLFYIDVDSRVFFSGHDTICLIFAYHGYYYIYIITIIF